MNNPETLPYIQNQTDTQPQIENGQANRAQMVALDKKALEVYKRGISNKDYVPRYEITGLSEGVIRIINLAIAKKLDALFFLDRTARPCGFLFLKTWHAIYPGINPPQIKYIYIGRQTNMDRLNSESEIQTIRKSYPGLTEKNVGVIDAFVDSGETMIKAKKVMEQALPSTKIYYSAMMDDIPSWEDEEFNTGMNTANIDSLGTPHFLAESYKGPYKWISMGVRNELSKLAIHIAHHVRKRQRYKKNVSEPFIPSYATEINQLKKEGKLLNPKD